MNPLARWKSRWTKPLHLRGIEPVGVPLKHLWRRPCEAFQSEQAFWWLCEQTEEAGYCRHHLANFKLLLECVLCKVLKGRYAGRLAVGVGIHRDKASSRSRRPATRDIRPSLSIIGKAEKGFNFLRLHCCPTPMRVSAAAQSRQHTKIARPYVRSAERKCNACYIAKWLGCAALCGWGVASGNLCSYSGGAKFIGSFGGGGFAPFNQCQCFYNAISASYYARANFGGADERLCDEFCGQCGQGNLQLYRCLRER